MVYLRTVFGCYVIGVLSVQQSSKESAVVLGDCGHLGYYVRTPVCYVIGDGLHMLWMMHSNVTF